STTDGDTPAAVGNRIGAATINAFANDGANEIDDYVDTTGYKPVNPAMVVDDPGAGALVDPSMWQELILAQAVTQNGIVQPPAQKYIGSNWDLVTPFAMTRDQAGVPYFDPGPVPKFEAADLPSSSLPYSIEVARRSSYLDATDGVTMEIGPA